MLDSSRHRVGSEVTRDRFDVEGPRGRWKLQVEGNQTYQRDQRTQTEVKSNLKSRVVLVFAPAPDTDHDKRRHQGQLVKKIEEEQVKGGERAKDSASHYQQQNVKLLFVRFD